MQDLELNPYPSSKLGPPRYGRPPVARPRLLSRLETQAPLLLMVAPAGSGKTALLTSWVASRPDIPCLWYRLDPADREPLRLVDGLAAASERALPGSGQAARIALARSGSPFAALSLLLAHLEQAPRAILILDDCHHLDGARGAEAIIEQLVRARPPTLRLVLAARTAPLLPAIAALAAGELSTIGRGDLQFSADEAAALLAGHGFERAATPSLVRSSEGWAMGLLLLAHAQAGHISFLRQPAEALTEYLLTQVVDGVPDALRGFLLESALLGSFSAAEADQILERGDSRHCIELVLRNGLFLERESDGPLDLVRYHDLFAIALAGMLRREHPARFAAIHERAASARAAEPPRMLAHLAALGEPTRLATALNELLPRLHADYLWETIISYARQVPESTHSVLLQRYLSFACFNVGDLAEAVRQADLAYAAAVASGDQESAYSALVLRANPLGRLDRHEDVLARCLPALDQARAAGLAPPVRWLSQVCGEAYLSLGRIDEGRQLFLAVLADWRAQGQAAANQRARITHDLAHLLLTLGEDSEARAYLEQATQQARENHLDSLLAHCQATQTELLIQHGDYVPASTLAAQAAATAREWGNDTALRLALLSQATASCHIGQIEAGLGALDQYVIVRSTAESPHLQGLGLCVRARLLLAAGDREGARAALNRALALQLTGRALGGMLTELGALALADGRAADADRHLSAACATLEGRGIKPALARALLLRAEALWRLSKEARAVACLSQAGELSHGRDWLGGLAVDAEPALGALRALASHWNLASRGRHMVEHLLRAATGRRARLVAPAAPTPSVQPGVTALGEPSLRFSPFADGTIYRDGERLALNRLGSEKARELLAFAVWKARPVTREEILDALWDGATDERTQGALRAAGYRIRRLLGEESWGKLHGAYNLTVPVEDDYRRLLTLAVSVDDPEAPRASLVGLAAQGLALYSGEYLPWCSSPWVEGPRGLARRAAMTLVTVVVEARRALGQPQLALDAAERGLEIEPASETLRQAQISLLIEQGRTTDAVAAYRAHLHILEDEGLGAPSRELQRLIAALRHG